MDLPIHIDPDLQYAVRLPHRFLNHLLEDGYQFDQGVLCLKVTGGFGCCYCSMTEFKGVELGDAIDIGYEINQYLNLVTGEYVHVEQIQSQTPALIKVQGHRESFGKILNLKEQLERLLVQVKVLNTGTEFTCSGPDGPEQFTIVRIENEEGHEMLWGLTVESDVEVDFMKTKEAEEIEKQAEEERKQREERESLERRGFHGNGHRLGGHCARQVWINQLQHRINTKVSAKASPKKD